MKFCTGCGKEMEDDDVFCHACGKKHGETSAEVKVYESDISPKSRLAATIMAGAGGAIGIHNFYLGQIGRGLAKAILFGVSYILFIISYVQFIFDMTSIRYESDLEDAMMSFMGNFFIFYAIILGVSIWALVEFILIVSGKGKDKNGLKVKEWIVKD